MSQTSLAASSATPAGSGGGSQSPPVLVHSAYVFDKHGTCLYYSEWPQPQQQQSQQPPSSAQNHPQSEQSDHENRVRLMYGLIYSIRTLAAKLCPVGEIKDTAYLSYLTSQYKFHLLDVPTGLKIVLNTDKAAGSMRQQLEYIYSSIYVPCVVRNPECQLNEPVSSRLFAEKVNEYVLALQAK